MKLALECSVLDDKQLSIAIYGKKIIWSKYDYISTQYGSKYVAVNRGFKGYSDKIEHIAQISSHFDTGGHVQRLSTSCCPCLYEAALTAL